MTSKKTGCEVCGGSPPPGHRFCDKCWPEAAIRAGLAVRCELCQTPKIVEKLHRDEQNRLVCPAHP